MDRDDSFLPKIVGLFFAVFDPTRGPKVLHQVPANLISTHAPLPSTNLSSSISSLPDPYPSTASSSASSSIRSRSQSRPRARAPSRARSPLPPYANGPAPTPSTSASSLHASSSQPPPPTPSTSILGLPSHPSSSLLNFSSISEFIVPKDVFSSQLITVAAGPYKIISFPVVTGSENEDERNFFRWNLAWVFQRERYEGGEFDAVVRKVARVLKHCEAETNFLSSSSTSPQMFQILQQLYEDLNSYGESSIPIGDRNNSIEVKIFPTLPNPPDVQDWHVPTPLLDLKKLQEPNWDLTMTKVVSYIDGIRHVKKIAECADATPHFTRVCIQHLLYYQGCMLLDIFQYSNMYTLKPAIQHLAELDHVKNECAAYSMRDPSLPRPSWPTLLRLYTLLQPGTTIAQWIEQHDIPARHNIDVRRFVSFGCIKGFLRRVHRWPVFESNLAVGVGTDGSGGGGDSSAFSFGGGGTGGDSSAEFGERRGVGQGGGGVWGGFNSSGITDRSTTTTLESGGSHGSGFSSHHQLINPPVHHNHSHHQHHHLPHQSAHHPTAHHPLFNPSHSTTSPSKHPPPPNTNAKRPLPTAPSLVTPNPSHPNPHSHQLPLPSHTHPPAPRHRASARARRDAAALSAQLSYPPGLTLAYLDGETCSDALCVEFRMGWGGDRGMEVALERFGRDQGGRVRYLLR